LVRGLAQVVAEDFAAEGREVIFAEVDPHALPSQMLGESQRNVVNLLEKSLPELAAKGPPVIVAVDEVDSLVTARSLATGGRDPVDVMRATEAALRGVDFLASMAKNVLIVATSNFSAALDEALLDRLDLAIEVGLPDAETLAEILRDTLRELPQSAISDDEILELATALEGQSGRAVRKLVLEALVTRPDPSAPFTYAELDSVVKRHRAT
jgi:pachytene checkpoint protein 2